VCEYQILWWVMMFGMFNFRWDGLELRRGSEHSKKSAPVSARAKYFFPQPGYLSVTSTIAWPSLRYTNRLLTLNSIAMVSFCSRGLLIIVGTTDITQFQPIQSSINSSLRKTSTNARFTNFTGKYPLIPPTLIRLINFFCILSCQLSAMKTQN